MCDTVSADSVALRFDKVLRFYWDGIPVPPFAAEKTVGARRSFSFRLLGFSPDYHGDVTIVDLDDKSIEKTLFSPLSAAEPLTASMSSRIASHYSPFVGFFRFREINAKQRHDNAGEKNSFERIRIPSTPCESYEGGSFTPAAEARKYIRMKKLTKLYEPLVREFSAISQDSLRRITILATQGFQENSMQWVVRELSIVSDEYTSWQSEAIFYYMCTSPLFCRIMSPLQMLTQPTLRKALPPLRSAKEQQVSLQRFREAKHNLSTSLMWKSDTRDFFLALRVLWDRTFSRLALFDLSIPKQSIRSGDFLEQITSSLRAACAKIRIELYSNMEDFLFSYVCGAKSILSMSEEEVRASTFQRIFLTCRVFVVNRLRSLTFENLDRLVSFMNCYGKGGQRISQSVAAKHPLLQVELVVGDKYEPRSPAFSHFRFGLLDVFDETLKCVNSFPLPECAILRTLNFGDARLEVISPLELAGYRTSVSKIFDEVGSTIDDLAREFSQYSSVPVTGAKVAVTGSFDDVKEYVELLRQRQCAVERVCPSYVYSGCFAIECTAVKQEYNAVSARCLARFYEQYHAHIANVVKNSDEMCSEMLKDVEKYPRNVKEVEALLAAAAKAKVLSTRVRENECQQVIKRFGWVEEIQIPVDPAVYASAVSLMLWPERLAAAADQCERVRQECKPLLVEQLNRQRREIRSLLKTLSTGVTELYNMFNLEICDIAAQTCTELRELVDQISVAVETVRQQEAFLEVSVTDSFDDFASLLNYFEIIEQYWVAVYKATSLRKFYMSPVSTLDANKAIDDVRDWRRLIHNSTRNLRGFVPLARLGRQQEVALARFEALEELLLLLTTPGLRKSHWKEIFRLVAGKTSEDPGFTGEMTMSLQRLLDAGITERIPELERIASQARSDYDAETSLEEMKSAAKKISFEVVPTAVKHVSRPMISVPCRLFVQTQLEAFVQRSRNLRQNSSVSSFVLKAVSEWEVASERARELFFRWAAADESWDKLYAFYLSTRSTTDVRADAEHTQRSQMKVLNEKLQRTAEALQTLYDAISKPQFSLYMAIVQDSLGDHLLTAIATMHDINASLGTMLANMRNEFPRFHFVADAELSTFLSPYNVDSLRHILPLMYGELCDVAICDGAIVSFEAFNGGQINAAEKLHIIDAPVEKWMCEFDRCLISSFFEAIVACTNEYGQVDLDTWLSTWCSQLVVMALRITHTKEMREVLQFAGLRGLYAYKAKLGCVAEEMRRIASASVADVKVRERAGNASMYLQHAIHEVERAVATEVSSCADLDTSVMMQTFLTKSTVIVRLLGLDLPYGFEFLGDYHATVLASPVVEKAVEVIVSCYGVEGSVPLLCGGVEKDLLFSIISRVMGSFVLDVHSPGDAIPVPTVLSIVRGAAQTGVMLCLRQFNCLTQGIIESVALSFSQAQEARSKRKRSTECSNPSVAADEGVADAPTCPRFCAVFASDDVEEMQRNVKLDCHPLHVPHLNSTEVIRSLMRAFGGADPTGSATSAFGTFYDRCGEVSPSVFTLPSLLAVIRRAVLDPTPPAEDPPRQLYHAFVTAFRPHMLNDHRVRDLLHWSISNEAATARASSVECTALRSAWSSSALPFQNDALSSFTDMMSTFQRVVIIGPPFSGKERLWRQWAKSMKHVIISPSLMSSADLYGVGSRRGVLCAIADSVQSSLHPQVIVVEEPELTAGSFLATYPPHGRVIGGEGYLFRSLASRLLITTRNVRGMNPHQASDVGLFYLPPTRDWRRFLRRCIRDCRPSARDERAKSGAPYHHSVALQVMEILLPALAAVTISGVFPSTFCAEDEARDSTVNDSEPASEAATNLFFALCQRSASLYVLWHQFATRQFASLLGQAPKDGLVDPKVFTGQCAILAACWSAGLSLPLSEQPRIMSALRSVEKAIQHFFQTEGIAEAVLPPFGEREENVLNLVATCGGWKKFEEASAFGITQLWSKFTRVNAQNRAWEQRFALPMRAGVVGAVECLLNCGQNVLLSGPHGSGKSSLLGTVRHHERWQAQLTSVTNALDPAVMQEAMLTCLTRRSTGRYGPTPGSKFVLCVDDVHISEDLGSDLSLAERFLSFYEKHHTISTASAGLVPTTDVVVLATTTPKLCDPTVARGYLEVCLPVLTGAELVNGIWQLFESVCAKKRVSGFPRECASFLALAHVSFLRLLTPSQFTETTETAEDMASTPGGLATGAPNESPQANPLVADAQRFFSLNLDTALRAADYIRHHLVNPVSDAQVATNAFSAVCSVYESALRNAGHGTEVAALQSQMAACARGTLGECVREGSFSSMLSKAERKSRDAEGERTLPQDASPDELQWKTSDADRSRVADWIKDFETSASALKETFLFELYEQQSSTSAAAASGKDADDYGTDDVKVGDMRSCVRQSILLTYTAGGSPAPTGNGALTPVGRSGMGSARRSSLAGRRQSAAGVFVGGGVSSRRGSVHPDAFDVLQADLRISRTYQTTWLTANLILLYRTVHQLDSSIILVGAGSFGVDRLLRIFCRASRTPLALYREAHEHETPDAALAELKAVIIFAYSHDTRVNTYMPFVTMMLPGVLRQIDIVSRVGDISELFTPEEYTALARGYQISHRGLTRLTATEYSEVQRRVRRNLRFILQVPSLDALQDLQRGYPLLLELPAVHSSSPALCSLRLREIVVGIMSEELEGKGVPASATSGALLGDAISQNKEVWTSIFNDPDALAETLCALFDIVRQEWPCVLPEQLMELAREVHKLGWKQLAAIKEGTRLTEVVIGRADEATAEMARDEEEWKKMALLLSESRARVQSLQTRLNEEELRYDTRRTNADDAEAATSEAANALAAAETALAASLQKSARTFAGAATKLRKVKSAHVRSMGVLRLPEKGILLVKAVYRTLGEELPNAGNSPSTLWTMALKVMCTPEFPGRLASRVPDMEKDPNSLLTMEGELSEVRFANASPYAQVMADFVLAFMAQLRAQILAREEEEPRLQAQRVELEELKQTTEDLKAKAERALARKTSTASAIADEEAACAELKSKQVQLEERKTWLMRYIGLVDRFSHYTPQSVVAERRVEARCAEGNAILVPAFFSLLSRYPNADALYEKLRKELERTKGIVSSPAHDAPCQSLLFPGHRTLAEKLIPHDLPRCHRLTFYSLSHRAASQWVLLGGVCSTFEGILRELLSVGCTSCITVSALDSSAVKQVQRAMKEGQGVLLREAQSSAALALFRELLPLLRILQRRLGGRISHTDHDGGGSRSALPSAKKQEHPLGSGPSEGTDPSAERNAKVPFRAFGCDIEVDPRFFMVGISMGIVNPETTATMALCQELMVVNFHVPLPQEMRARTLLQKSTTPKNILEEARERRTQLVGETLAFIHTHSTALRLLGRDLRVIFRHADKELSLMEHTITDVGVHDGQHAHALMLLQNSVRLPREEWQSLSDALRRVDELLTFVECTKLGRPLDGLILDSFVASMTKLSPVLVARLSPQSFADLPKPEQCFYALVNLLDSIISSFSCGWPVPVRGIFGLYVFSGTVLASADVEGRRGKRFPSDTELLTETQFAVLHQLLAGTSYTDDELQDEAESGDATTDANARRAWILQLYSSSDDMMLQELAKDMRTTLSSFTVLSTVSGSELPRRSFNGDSHAFFLGLGSWRALFFRAFAELDFIRCESAALQLCGSFFAAVKDANAMPRKEPSATQPSGSVSSHTARTASTVGGARRSSVHGSLRGGGDLTTHGPLKSVPLRDTEGSSVRDGVGSAGGEVASAIREIHSTDGLAERAVRDGLPLCVITNFMEGEVRTLKREAQSRSWAFHWRKVDSAAACAAAARDLLRCFHRRPLKKRGHWVVFAVDRGDKERASAARDPSISAPLHGNTPYNDDFVLEVRQLVDAFSGYRASQTASGDDGANASVPVCLVVVCSPRVHEVLWPCFRNTRVCARSNRPLYISRAFPCPRDHLLGLLLDNVVQDGLGAFSVGDVSQVVADASSAAGRKHRLLKAKNAQAAAEAAEWSALEATATLLAKELAVAHASLHARCVLRCQQWSLMSAPDTTPALLAHARRLAFALPDSGDESLIAVLRFVHRWVDNQLCSAQARRRAEGADGARLSLPAGSVCVCPAPSAPGKPAVAVPNLPQTNTSGEAAAATTLGLKAYFFYRGQRSLWSLYADATACEAAPACSQTPLGTEADKIGSHAGLPPTQLPLSFSSLMPDVPALGIDTADANELPSRAKQRTPSPAVPAPLLATHHEPSQRWLSRLPRQLQRVLFAVLPKVAVWASTGGLGPFAVEPLVAQHVLSATLVPVVGHGTVSVGGPAAARASCVLTLDSTSDFAKMMAELADAPTDMNEFAGDAETVAAYREATWMYVSELLLCNRSASGQPKGEGHSGRAATTAAQTETDVSDALEELQSAAAAWVGDTCSCNNSAGGDAGIHWRPSQRDGEEPFAGLGQAETSALLAWSLEKAALLPLCTTSVAATPANAVEGSFKTSQAAVREAGVESVRGVLAVLRRARGETSTRNAELWLPALVCPRLSLTLLARASFINLETVLAGRANSCEGDGTGQADAEVDRSPQLLVVVGERGLLAPTDIVLRGARPSPMLLQEARRLAGHTGLARRKTRSSASCDMPGETDVVVAVRMTVAERRSGAGPDEQGPPLTTLRFDGEAWGVSDTDPTADVSIPLVTEAETAEDGLWRFLWRTVPQANQDVPETLAAASTSTRPVGAMTVSTTESPPFSLAGVLSRTAALPHGSAVAQSSSTGKRGPALPTTPEIKVPVQATSAFLTEMNGDASQQYPRTSPSAASVARPSKLAYALSTTPLPLYISRLGVGRSGAADAGAPSESAGPLPLPSWRDTFEAPVCIVFECRDDPVSGAGASIGASSAVSSSGSATTALATTGDASMEDWVGSPFSRGGTLGMFILCS